MSTQSHVCLLLSYDYVALRIIDFKQAFKLVFSDKAEIVTEFVDKAIRTVNKVFKIPAVIRLLKKVSLRFNVRLTRKNILVRDNYTCQYCGKQGSASNLTLDHCIPQSRGGKFVWENMVASCLDCNSRKGNKTVQEARMSLLCGKPKRLDMHQYIRCLIDRKLNIPEWRSFIS